MSNSKSLNAFFKYGMVLMLNPKPSEYICFCKSQLLGLGNNQLQF